MNEISSYINCGIYIRHLKNWLKYFPLQQILILNGEKLITDPYSVLQIVEKYLNLKPLIKPGNFVFDKNKGFMCIRRKRKIGCLDDSKGRKHIDISNELRSKISEFYEPYNKQLFELIEQDPFF